MDTDLDEVVRKRKDTLDGLLSKLEFAGETEEVKLSTEEKQLLREAWKKESWGDRTWQFETARLEEPAADVLFFPRTQMDGTATTWAAVTNSQERLGCDPFAGSSEREV